MRFETVNKVVKRKVKFGNKINIAKTGLQAIYRERALSRYQQIDKTEETAQPKRSRTSVPAEVLRFVSTKLNVMVGTFVIP